MKNSMKKLYASLALCSMVFASAPSVYAQTANSNSTTAKCESTQGVNSKTCDINKLNVKNCTNLYSLLSKKACAQASTLLKDCKVDASAKDSNSTKKNCDVKSKDCNAASKPSNTSESNKPADTKKPVENNNKPTEPSKPSDSSKPSTSTNVSDVEKEVARLVNVERQKAGLKALTLDNALSNVARTKSQDMADKNYFDHNSPTYGSPFDMLKKFGISYQAAGENIAMGQKTAQEVMTAWMNSSGHRANILSSKFGKIGVGYVVKNGTPYWTQTFTN